MNGNTAQTAEVAHALVDGCRAGQNLDIVEKYYADDIVSVEATPDPDGVCEYRGKDAIRGKHDWWYSNHEVHGGKVDGPFIGDDGRFAVRFEFDVTPKATGQRYTMTEAAIYTVANGKIVREEFFYNQPGA